MKNDEIEFTIEHIPTGKVCPTTHKPVQWEILMDSQYTGILEKVDSVDGNYHWSDVFGDETYFTASCDLEAGFMLSEILVPDHPNTTN